MSVPNIKVRHRQPLTPAPVVNTFVYTRYQNTYIVSQVSGAAQGAVETLAGGRPAQRFICLPVPPILPRGHATQVTSKNIDKERHSVRRTRVRTPRQRKSSPTPQSPSPQQRCWQEHLLGQAKAQAWQCLGCALDLRCSRDCWKVSKWKEEARQFPLVLRMDHIPNMNKTQQEQHRGKSEFCFRSGRGNTGDSTQHICLSSFKAL